MRARIVFETLPNRPRLLDAEEVSAIFGGCGQYQEVCQADGCDCCAGFVCDAYSPQTGQHYCIQFK
jgi:hypothetical protein